MGSLFKASITAPFSWLSGIIDDMVADCVKEGQHCGFWLSQPIIGAARNEPSGSWKTVYRGWAQALVRTDCPVYWVGGNATAGFVVEPVTSAVPIGPTIDVFATDE